jgi:hypothetical protein
MRKLFSSGVLALLLSVLSSPVVAAVEDCDVLKGGGGSKGLYGMCVAYWNSVKNSDDSGLQSNRIDDSNRFLDKYNSIRDRVGGPEMPGLSSSPNLECACWSYLTFGEAQAGVFSAFYGGSPTFFETLEFYNESNINIRGFAVGAFNNSCIHTNSIDGLAFRIVVAPAGLSDEQTLQCQAELQILSELDAD